MTALEFVLVLFLSALINFSSVGKESQFFMKISRFFVEKFRSSRATVMTSAKIRYKKRNGFAGFDNDN